MKYKHPGQITLETVIIMPIVMIVVATFMCIALYIHDVIVIKSYGYSLAMEHRDENLENFAKNIMSKMTKASLFVTGTNIKCSKEAGTYKIVVGLKSQDETGWLGTFFYGRKDITIEVERKLNLDIMYAARAVYDNFE